MGILNTLPVDGKFLADPLSSSARKSPRIQFTSHFQIHTWTNLPMTVQTSRVTSKGSNISLMRNEATWCTDGSTFIKDGTGYAGAAVTPEDRVIWEETLPLGISAQRTELIDFN